jgi:hypothetical protein
MTDFITLCFTFALIPLTYHTVKEARAFLAWTKEADETLERKEPLKWTEPDPPGYKDV